jgi:hypothetical protein
MSGATLVLLRALSHHWRQALQGRLLQMTLQKHSFIVMHFDQHIVYCMLNSGLRA